MTNPDIVLFTEELQIALTEARRFCCFTRDEIFRASHIDQLAMLSGRVSRMKLAAIEDNDNDSANLLLSFESMIFAVINELRMWISLKERSYENAWEFLVTAQQVARTALRAHSVGHAFEEYSLRLLSMDDILFPSMVFFSPGMIVKEAICSVCDKEYSRCPHIVGRAYMGQECHRIIRKLEIKEISFVNNPANKMARAISLTDDGVIRDYLTWTPRDTLRD